MLLSCYQSVLLKGLNNGRCCISAMLFLCKVILIFFHLQILYNFHIIDSKMLFIPVSDFTVPNHYNKAFIDIRLCPIVKIRLPQC